MSARVARMAETAQIVEATSRAAVELQEQREVRSQMAQVLVEQETMCDVSSVSVGVDESSESVAIGTHQDVNAGMSFTQLEASRLTPPWGQQFQ